MQLNLFFFSKTTSQLFDPLIFLFLTHTHVSILLALKKFDPFLNIRFDWVNEHDCLVSVHQLGAIGRIFSSRESLRFLKLHSKLDLWILCLVEQISSLNSWECTSRLFFSLLRAEISLLSWLISECSKLISTLLTSSSLTASTSFLNKASVNYVWQIARFWVVSASESSSSVILSLNSLHNRQGPSLALSFYFLKI